MDGASRVCEDGLVVRWVAPRDYYTTSTVVHPATQQSGWRCARVHAYDHALGAMSEHGNVHVGLRSGAAIDRPPASITSIRGHSLTALLRTVHLGYGRPRRNLHDCTTTSTASSSSLRGPDGRSPHCIMLAWRPCSMASLALALFLFLHQKLHHSRWRHARIPRQSKFRFH